MRRARLPSGGFERGAAREDRPAISPSRSSRLVAALAGLLGAVLAGPGLAQAAGQPETPSVAYRIETVAEGLPSPATLAFLPDGRMLVGERAGPLRLIGADGRLQPEPLTGTPSDGLDDESGLIDVVPDPDFARNQRLFLTSMHGSTRANRLRVITARLQGTQLVELRTLFEAQPAKSGRSNFGGRLLFLPDKTLLVSIGDGFDHREQAQRGASHLGKLLRLQRDGSAAPDNPYARPLQEGEPPRALPEIYGIGHRNVQGLARDAATGRLYASDHGAKGGDEINRLAPGANHGWPLATFGVDYVGARVTPYTELPGLVPPLLHWTPSLAPSALAVYRGAAFPAWQGDLFAAMLVGKAVVRVRLDGDRVVAQEKLFTELDARFRDVKVGPDGLLYLLTDEKQGRLLRVRPAP